MQRVFNVSRRPPASNALRAFNVDWKKVGGIWFVKIGRLNFSFCVSRAYSPVGAPAEQ